MKVCCIARKSLIGGQVRVVLEVNIHVDLLTEKQTIMHRNRHLSIPISDVNARMLDWIAHPEQSNGLLFNRRIAELVLSETTQKDGWEIFEIEIPDESLISHPP